MSTVYHLESLGRISLRSGDATEVDALLRQPKRLAVLAYLASPAPGTWHRRDILLGLFWPELDSARGRTALRNALHVLRQHLGDGVIRTRGDQEVSVDASQVTTDASLMERDAASGDHATAFSRFRGPYLNGLFIKDAAEFERWLDGERVRLRAIARKSGNALAVQHEQAGNHAGAVDVLERVVSLDPADESSARQLITALDRAGDRSRALAVYERLKERLLDEYDAEPSAETVALAYAIRNTRAAIPSVATLPSSPQPTPPAAPPIDVTRSRDAEVVRPFAWHRSWRWVPGLAAGLVALLVMRPGFADLTGWSREATSARPAKLLILPVKNATGDSSLEYLTTGIADGVARLVRGVGGLDAVHSAAHVVVSVDSPAAPVSIGRQYGVRVAWRSSMHREADSLMVASALVDIATGRVDDMARVSFRATSATDAASRIAAELAGQLFRAPFPLWPHERRQPSLDPESVRLTMAGWHQLLRVQDADQAKASFLAALQRDPANARAQAGMSSVWASLAVTWGEEFEIAAERAEQYGRQALALDSLEGTPWANLGIIEGLRSRRLSRGIPLIEKGIALDPSNAELHLVKSALYRHAWDWERALHAARVAQRLDPLSPLYLRRVANAYRCMGDVPAALRVDRQALALDSSDVGSRRDVARDLARLERWSEAVTVLRPGAPPPAAVAESTYWAITEARWRAQLRRLEAQQGSQWVSPTRLAVTTIAAGDLEKGMAMLESVAPTSDPGLYRLPCQEQVDRVRAWPRYQAVLDRLPRWND